MANQTLLKTRLGSPRKRYMRRGGRFEEALVLALGSRHTTGTLRVTMPDGAEHFFPGTIEPELNATMEIRDTRFVRRFIMRGAIGFAESYIDGDWDTPDLARLLVLLDRNRKSWVENYHGNALSRAGGRALHWLRRNSRAGSRRNIRAHYDLGNDFYAAWLDPSLTYSSAYFGSGAADLEAAQLAKYRELCRRIDLRPGQKLLEIGCGWGGFAILAAKEFGAEVTAVTVSKAQLDLARRRVRDAGLEDRIEVRLQDYRDIEGSFDRIASIEMFEAVGEEYWQAFFSKLRERLKPDGRAGLQIITIDDEHFDEYRGGPDFIQRYIFPGGMLPSPSALAGVLSAARLQIVDRHSFGADYARTLGLWLERFEAGWRDLEAQGFDETFRRLWRYYLCYCETGFTNGATEVSQFVVAPSSGRAR